MSLVEKAFEASYSYFDSTEMKNGRETLLTSLSCTHYIKMSRALFSRLHDCARALLILAVLVTSDAQSEELLRFTTMGKNLSFPTKTVNLKIITEAYKRIGYRIEIEEHPAARAILIANRGESDGELFRKKGIQENFSNLIMVPVATHRNEFVAFTKKLDIKLGGCASLRPYRVVIESGVVNSEECVQGLPLVERLRKEKLLFRLVDMDRADIAIDTRLDGNYLIRQQGITSLKVLEPALRVSYSHHYLHKKHKALVPKITAVLQAMIDEGVVERIQESVLVGSADTSE